MSENQGLQKLLFIWRKMSLTFPVSDVSLCSRITV